MNYDRPGPGVPKNAPPQKAVPRFFTILGRKFFDLIKLNLLFCIPTAVVVFLVFWINSKTTFTPVVLLPVILLSPFVAGLTFVTRNYVREEHAFILSDFMDAVKGNWKAFLINGALCYAVAMVLSYSIPFYWQNGADNGLFMVAAAVCVAVSVLLLFGQYYVPVMLVTFDLGLRQVYKNALIFAILGLWRNLLVTVLLALLVLVLYLAQIMVLTILLAILFAVFLLFAYCSFLVNFAVYPLIDKMMIQPYKKQEAEKKRLQGADQDAEEPTFTDSQK